MSSSYLDDMIQDEREIGHTVDLNEWKSLPCIVSDQGHSRASGMAGFSPEGGLQVLVRVALFVPKPPPVQGVVTWQGRRHKIAKARRDEPGGCMLYDCEATGG
jgi:hypothetical protein